MTIGERIKLKRKELGLTQTELAQRMGLTSKTTICKAETVNFNPTMDRVREFAKALECTPGYLMGWDDESLDVMDKIGNIEIMENENEKKALELYEKYTKADPNIKAAIEALLKGQQ